MIRNDMIRAGAILLLAAALMTAGCSSSGTSSDPRKIVMQFFGAMEKNDQASLAHLLDLPTLMKDTQGDYAFQTDSPRVWTSPKDILDDLTDGGKTKERWFSYQRIVGNSQVMGDNATVEVTFMNKETSTAYLTKFGLHKINDKWKIYTFRTEGEPTQSGADE